MRTTDVQYYVSPDTKEPLTLTAVTELRDGHCISGRLICTESSRQFSIEGGVPRFVSGEGYSASFGLQWRRFQKVQLDSQTGLSLSRDRFYNTSGWKTNDLRGLRILEAGCGAGRFTEILLQTEAELFAFDYSHAVDVVQEREGGRQNLYLAQANIFALPYLEAFFDRIFCYGVLQHTPDPRRALMNLVSCLKSGGLISVDLYLLRLIPSRWNAKYLWRPLTKRMDRQRLLKLIEWYIPRWLPIDTAVSRIPVLGRLIASLIPCWNYRGIFPLSEDQLVEWAILDTFDALSPLHDHPGTIGQLRRWCEDAGLVDINVHKGGNGIIANARRP